MNKFYFKLALHRHYFSYGLGLLNFMKYVLIAFGFASTNVKNTMIFALIYGLSCYAVGRWAYRYGFALAEIEVTNRINPFVQEMREKVIKKKI